MNTQAPSIYQRVIDKTKALAFQSQFLAQSIEKKLAPQAAPAYPGMVNSVVAYMASHIYVCIEVLESTSIQIV